MIINKISERITSQKKIILDYLKKITTHPSAEEVHLVVRKKLPRISLGTVYRVLKNLKEKGEIREVPYGVSHYDGNISPHSHFICEKCQKIFDIFEEYNVLKQKRTKVGKIKNYQVFFYGICKKCRKK